MLTLTQLSGFGGASSSSPPTWVDAGTAVSSTVAAGFNVGCPASVTSDNLLVFHITIIDNDSGVGSLPTMSTPSGWTLVGGPYSFDANSIGNNYVFYKVANGTEGGTNVSTGAIANFSNAVRRALARIYQFTGNATSSPIEGANVSNDASGTTVSDASVTTLGENRLCVQFVARANDGTMGNFTGETGGNWVEATAESTTTDGNDAGIQLQTATLTAAGTINGGSFTAGDTAEACVIGFAIKPR